MLFARHSALVKLFELSSCPAARVGPNALMTSGIEIVDDAGRDRRVQSHHHEVDLVRPAEIDHRGMV